MTKLETQNNYFLVSVGDFQVLLLICFGTIVFHQSGSDTIKVTLSDFCKKAEYKVREECDQVLPERFMVVTEAMWKGRWLESYQSIENIHFALQRMSTRSPRMAELVSCSDTLDQHYDRLKSIFTFYILRY